MKKTVIFLLLTILLVSSFLFPFGCGCDGDENDVSPYVKKEEIEEISDKYLLKHGYSEYSLLLPSSPTQSENLASEEFVQFMKQATGYSFDIINDDQVISSSKKYISIGNTAKKEKTGFSIDDKKYGKSGFSIKTKDGNIYILSSSDVGSNGVLYGVYYLLSHLVDYRCYAADEIFINKKTFINLYNYDVEIIPSVDVRSLNYGSVQEDDVYCNRMMLTLRGTSEWAVNYHTSFKIMPKEVYYEEHSDWYSKDGTQLCFSNEEMRAELVKNIKELIISNPQAIYVGITMEDSNTFCDCDRCRANVEKYGGSETGGEAGLEIVFVNKVADEIKNWLKENYPNRNIMFITYAYNKTFVPPVIYDSKKDDYRAVNEEVVPHENVSVMFCPIGQDYLYNINSLRNKSCYDAYRGWTAICDQVSVYEYGTNFYYYLINFNNFNYIQDRIKFYAQKRVLYYFEQASYSTKTPCFEALRVYVESRLLYDPSLSYNDLVLDFMDHYYKEASEYIYQYYTTLRTWYNELANREDISIDGGIYLTLLKSEYWPYGVLKSFYNIFDEAFKSIESLKQEDEKTYELVWHRINREKLSTTYLLCSLYGSYFTNEEYSSMVSDLEYYGGLYGFRYASSNGGNYTDAISKLKK